jgi:hypothetical protein
MIGPLYAKTHRAAKAARVWLEEKERALPASEPPAAA